MTEAITVGASISVSGRYALQGRQALAGLRAWVAAANAEGGVRMRGSGSSAPVNLVHYDDGSSPKGAAANIERLIRADRVQLLIGPYASDLARAAVSVSGRYGRVLWNHGGATDDLHREGGLVVGVLTPVSRYFSGVLAMAKRLDSRAARAAIIYRDNSPFGGLAASGAARLGRHAGVSMAALTYSSLPEDLPKVLQALQRGSPDLILSAGAFEDECALAAGLLAAGVRARAFAFTAAAMDKFGQLLGSEAEGFLGPSQWEPGAGHAVDFGPGSGEVARSIRAQGVAADYPAAQAYAACLIACRCLGTANSTGDEALWRAACAQDCTTFFGRFKIDPKTGLQAGHEMLWVQWQQGKKVAVWPPNWAETAAIYPRI